MNKERLWVFSPLDLIIPWGVGIGCAVICALLVFNGTPLGGDLTSMRVVSILTGLAFLSLIPLWYFIRSRLRKFDYKTSHGLYILLGATNRPAQEEVANWTEELIHHWERSSWVNKEGSQVICTSAVVKKAVFGLTVFFRDEEKLSVWGRWVRGYAEDRDVVIGYAPRVDYVHGLFLHELSHHVLNTAGEPWDEEWQHQIFQQTKLGE